MRRRRRKLIGVAATICFVVVYALVAMTLAQAPAIQNARPVLQWTFYATVGMGWILPIMPLIRWMERPDDGPVVDG